mmetsp:Transcript_26881/g.52650  ORF Transcript_26881/g.52650 Transcript_26881/m.52650 type:complete len:285 (-) Transcript_26881:93-947(-)
MAHPAATSSVAMLPSSFRPVAALVGLLQGLAVWGDRSVLDMGAPGHGDVQDCGSEEFSTAAQAKRKFLQEECGVNWPSDEAWTHGRDPELALSTKNKLCPARCKIAALRYYHFVSGECNPLSDETHERLKEERNLLWPVLNECSCTDRTVQNAFRDNLGEVFTECNAMPEPEKWKQDGFFDTLKTKDHLCSAECQSLKSQVAKVNEIMASEAQIGELVECDDAFIRASETLGMLPYIQTFIDKWHECSGEDISGSGLSEKASAAIIQHHTGEQERMSSDRRRPL